MVAQEWKEKSTNENTKLLNEFEEVVATESQKFVSEQKKPFSPELTNYVHQMAKYSHSLATREAKPSSGRTELVLTSEAKLVLTNPDMSHDLMVLHYGYFSGLMTAYLELNPFEQSQSYPLGLHLSISLVTLKHGIDSQSNDIKLIAYGAAIGYLQKISGENDRRWLLPVISFMNKKDYAQLNSYCLSNAQLFMVNQTIPDWAQISEDASNP